MTGLFVLILADGPIWSSTSTSLPGARSRGTAVTPPFWSTIAVETRRAAPCRSACCDGGTAGTMEIDGSTISLSSLNTSGQANGDGGAVVITGTGTVMLSSTITTSGGTANTGTGGNQGGNV